MPKLSQQAPTPDTGLLRRSESLLEAIRHRIEADGPMPFSQYMETCLYHPDWGYYTGQGEIFGEQGDFITAPEMGSLFAMGIAQHLAQLWLANHDSAPVPAVHLLEVGAGSGQLAYDIIQHWPQERVALASYSIIERSPRLIQRQQEKLTEHCQQAGVLLQHLNEMPHDFCGLVVANEVMDALPVERVSLTPTGYERQAVDWDTQQGQLVWFGLPLDDELATMTAIRMQHLQQALIEGTILSPYCTEIHQALPDWLKSFQRLQRGALLLVDYGYTRSEYYHPQRGGGSLMCHFRHHAYDEPLRWPGLQDITAFVDFTTVAECADNMAMDVMGYTTQGHFLMNSGVLQCLEAVEDPMLMTELAEQLRRLMLPGEMGERFQLMQLSRGFDCAGPGFEIDLRYRL